MTEMTANVSRSASDNDRAHRTSNFWLHLDARLVAVECRSSIEKSILPQRSQDLGVSLELQGTRTDLAPQTSCLA